MGDGISIRLEGGVQLDRKLAKMQQRFGTRAIKSALSKSATKLKAEMKRDVPQATKDTTGFKTSSRNVEKGQLKRSLQSGVLNKAKTDRQTFIAGVWFRESRSRKKDGSPSTKKNNDGFFAKWYYNDKPRAANAFGFRGGKSRELKRSVDSGRAKVRRILGDQLAQQIVKQAQKQIDSLNK